MRNVQSEANVSENSLESEHVYFTRDKTQCERHAHSYTLKYQTLILYTRARDTGEVPCKV